MRIAQIAPICLSLPPVNYGGAEMIISLLTDCLVRRGHEVTLYSTGDSKTSARLKYLYDKALGFGHDLPELCLAHANFSFQDADSFDIIHSHVGFYGLPFAKYAKPPVVATLHNDFIGINETFLNYYKDACNFVAISQNQLKRMPKINLAGYIHHGIDVENYQFTDKKEGYLLFIGNISKNKGADTAVKAALKLGKRLLLVGKVEPAHRTFFEQEIKPFVDNKQIVLQPLADHRQKQSLFGKAACLLFPIDWEEPFGLVMIEAMACGTPVAAYNRGSTNEIIRNGKNGYLANSFKELLSAIKSAEKINPVDCRKSVETCWTVERMTDQYEALYKKLAR